MKKRYMVIDVNLCHDCNNCFIACKDEHVENDWLPYTAAQPRHGHRWMNILRTERGQYPRVEARFLPMPCQHCQDAPCMKAHPDCISKRDDGIVMIDAAKAKGKKEVPESCPYGAIYWNEEENVPQKCTMCAHLMDKGWEQPRCTHACPTGAMSFYSVEPAEMDKIIAKEGLTQYHPEYNSNPNVYYKNQYKFEKNFIAGGIISKGDCVEGAKVSLKGDATCPEQSTNYFGDFKFDNLDPGTYTVVVNGKDVKSVTIEKSMNIGSIEI